MDSNENKNHKNDQLSQLPLTELEQEILVFIKEGKTSLAIATHKECSSRTIEKHRSNIIMKLKIPSSQNAILFWILSNPQYFY